MKMITSLRRWDVRRWDVRRWDVRRWDVRRWDVRRWDDEMCEYVRRWKKFSCASTIAYLDRGKLRDKRDVLSYVISECQSNRRMMSRYPGNDVKVSESGVRI